MREGGVAIDGRPTGGPPLAPAADLGGWCCSYCGAPLAPHGEGLLCADEQRWFATDDGVHRLLPDERRREILPFLELYQRVRRDEGWRAEPGPARRRRPTTRTRDDLAAAGARASGRGSPCCAGALAAGALGRAGGRRRLLPGPSARLLGARASRGGGRREPRSRRRPAAPPTACSTRRARAGARRGGDGRAAAGRAALRRGAGRRRAALRARPGAHAGRAAARHAQGRRCCWCSTRPSTGAARTARPWSPTACRRTSERYALPGPAREPVVVPRAWASCPALFAIAGLAARGARLAGAAARGPARRGRDRAPRPAHRAFPDPAGDGAMAERARGSGAAAAVAFDRAAPGYDEDFGRNPVGLLFRHAFQERLRRLFAPGARVLDLGCGTGEDALFLADAGRARARDRRRRRRWSSARAAKAERARPGGRACGVECARPRSVARSARGSTARTRTSARSTARRSARWARGSRARCGRARRCSSRVIGPLAAARRSSSARSSRRGPFRAAACPTWAGVPVPVRHPRLGALRQALGPAFAWTRRVRRWACWCPGPMHDALGRGATRRPSACWPRWSARCARWPVLRALGDHAGARGRAADELPPRAGARAALRPAGAGGGRPLRPALRHCQIWQGTARAGADARRSACASWTRRWPRARRRRCSRAASRSCRPTSGRWRSGCARAARA